MSKDIIIYDQEVYDVASFAKRQGEQLEFLMDCYIKILKRMNETAIKKGAVADALKEYINCTQELKNKVGVISNKIEGVCIVYIDEIDAADDYIF